MIDKFGILDQFLRAIKRGKQTEYQQNNRNRKNNLKLFDYGIGSINHGGVRQLGLFLQKRDLADTTGESE